MKKIRVITICLLLCFALVSCDRFFAVGGDGTQGKSTEQTEKEDDLKDDSTSQSQVSSLFDQYLSDLGLFPNLSQGDFIKIVEKFKYNGAPVTETAPGMHYDGEKGGGWAAQCDLYSFSNDYLADGDSVTYSNSIYTKVPLEGMAMPCGVTFKDSVEEVLRKIGFKMDISSGFFADEDSADTMTLFRSRSSKLVLIDLSRSTDENAKALDGYKLEYTQYYIKNDSGDREWLVTRCVTMSFSANGKLDSISVSVKESKIPVKDPQAEIKYTYVHPMYVDYKTVSNADIVLRIIEGLSSAKSTGEEVDGIVDGDYGKDDIDSYDIDVPHYTLWIEVGSDIYRFDPYWEKVARVDGFFGEGYYIEISEELRKDIIDAWQYHPRDYYYGEYIVSSNSFEIEHKYEAYSPISISVKSIDADEWGIEAKNSIVLEITSDQLLTTYITLECTQGGDVFTDGDSEVLTLKDDVPQTVTLEFGAFESRYYIYFYIDNTYYNISIRPD